MKWPKLLENLFFHKHVDLSADLEEVATTSKNSISLKYFLSDLDFFGLPSPLSMLLLLQLLVPSRLEGKIQFSELNDYCISFYLTFIFDAVSLYLWRAWSFFYRYLAACFLLCWPMFWKWSLLTNGSCFGRSLQIPPFLSFTVYFQCLHNVCCGIKGGGEEYGEHGQKNTNNNPILYQISA